MKTKDMRPSVLRRWNKMQAWKKVTAVMADTFSTDIPGIFYRESPLLKRVRSKD